MTEDTWREGHWMQTHSGRQFYPLDPQPADIDPFDIAHALSNLCRYAGHVDRFYSVAEHCVLMSYAVAPEFALLALLHDATEAYVVDVPRPLKLHLPEYRAIEARVALAIAYRFGLPTHVVEVAGDAEERAFEPPEVKDADTRILLDERRALMSRTTHRWDVDDREPLDVEIHAWSPEDANRAYLTRLVELDVIGGADYLEAVLA